MGEPSALLRTKRSRAGFAETLRRATTNAATTRPLHGPRPKNAVRATKERTQWIRTRSEQTQSDRNLELAQLIAEQQADMERPYDARQGGAGSRGSVRGSVSLDEPISRHDLTSCSIGTILHQPGHNIWSDPTYDSVVAHLELADRKLRMKVWEWNKDHVRFFAQFDNDSSDPYFMPSYSGRRR